MISSCYVYAVQACGVPLPSKLTGFQGRRLFVVPYRDLEAVVSQIDRDVLQATEENVLHHEAVVEAVRQMGPAIPVRFGTLLHDPAAVASALEARYATLSNDLERLGDKVELGLTVLWHEPIAIDNGGHDDHSDAQTPGTRYLRAKFSQYHRDAQLHEIAGRLARELDSELSSYALERRCTVLPSRRLLMRASYLVRRADRRVFQDAIAELSRKHSDLRFLLTGPWPPYSFVTTTESDGISGLDRLLHHAGTELWTAVHR